MKPPVDLLLRSRGGGCRRTHEPQHRTHHEDRSPKDNVKVKDCWTLAHLVWFQSPSAPETLMVYSQFESASILLRVSIIKTSCFNSEQTKVRQGAEVRSQLTRRDMDIMDCPTPRLVCQDRKAPPCGSAVFFIVK